MFPEKGGGGAHLQIFTKEKMKKCLEKIQVLDCRALSPGIAKPQVYLSQGDSQEVMGKKRSSSSLCCYKWIMGWGSRKRKQKQVRTVGLSSPVGLALRLGWVDD